MHSIHSIHAIDNAFYTLYREHTHASLTCPPGGIQDGGCPAGHILKSQCPATFTA